MLSQKRIHEEGTANYI